MRKYHLSVYSVIALAFVISVPFMLFYGYKTFYVHNETAEQKDDTYHVAFIAEEEDNEYWDQIYQGAKKAAAEQSVYVDYIAPKKASNDEALTLLDRMIAAKVDGIIIYGMDQQRFTDLVHKGAERGIPVVTVDADMQNSERKAYLGSDNRKAGKKLAQAVIESTEEESHIGIIIGREDSVSQQERVEGFEQEIKTEDKAVISARETSDMTAIGASLAVYQMFKEHPEITAFAGFSALDGAGAAEGLQDINPHSDIDVYAFDTLPVTINWMEQGVIKAAVDQRPTTMGKEAVQTMLRLQGKDQVSTPPFTETTIIRKSDAVKWEGNSND